MLLKIIKNSQSHFEWYKRHAHYILYFHSMDDGYWIWLYHSKSNINNIIIIIYFAPPRGNSNWWNRLNTEIRTDYFSNILLLLSICFGSHACITDVISVIKLKFTFFSTFKRIKFYFANKFRSTSFVALSSSRFFFCFCLSSHFVNKNCIKKRV